MPKERTLQTIRKDIEDGKLGIARDRLHGLVNSFPNDLSLRSRLGDVYWSLGYPKMAGRYWFLEECLEERKEDAVLQFVAECKENPSIILKRLKLQCHPDQLSEHGAIEKIDQMVRQCKERNLKIPEFKRVQETNLFWINAFSVGCLVLLVIVIALAFIGLMSLIYPVKR